MCHHHFTRERVQLGEPIEAVEPEEEIAEEEPDRLEAGPIPADD